MEHTSISFRARIHRFFMPKNSKQGMKSVGWMALLLVGTQYAMYYLKLDIHNPLVNSTALIITISSFAGILYFGIRTLIFSRRETVDNKKYVDNLPFVSFDSEAKDSTDRFRDFANQNGYLYTFKPSLDKIGDIQQAGLVKKGFPTFRIEGVYRQRRFSMTAIQRRAGDSVAFSGIIRVEVSTVFLKNRIRETFEAKIETYGIIDRVDYDSYAAYLQIDNGLPSGRAQMLRLFEIIDIAIECDQNNEIK